MLWSFFILDPCDEKWIFVPLFNWFFLSIKLWFQKCSPINTRHSNWLLSHIFIRKLIVHFWKTILVRLSWSSKFRNSLIIYWWNWKFKLMRSVEMWVGSLIKILILLDLIIVSMLFQKGELSLLSALFQDHRIICHRVIFFMLTIS